MGKEVLWGESTAGSGSPAPVAALGLLGFTPEALLRAVQTTLLTVASRGTTGSDMGLQLKEEVIRDGCRNMSSAKRKIMVNMGRERPSSSFSPPFLPSISTESRASYPTLDG